MPDPYWEAEIARIRALKGGDILDSGERPALTVVCKKCKKEFENEKTYRRVLCDDCKPECAGNSEGPRSMGRRFTEAEYLERDDDP
jgi:hypothetical protein